MMYTVARMGVQTHQQSCTNQKIRKISTSNKSSPISGGIRSMLCTVLVVTGADFQLSGSVEISDYATKNARL